MSRNGVSLRALQLGDHLVPLLGGDVVAGRVVAAGVQHDDGAGHSRVQRCQHAGKIDRAACRVVVGIAGHREAGVGEQRKVVLPARVADHHAGSGAELLQEIGADLQAAGAADGLDRGHAAGADRLGAGAEHQALDGRVVRRDTVDRQVAARLGRVHHGFFGGLHTLQQRQLAVFVVVDPNAQVHLVRIGVRGELFVQTQDRVARGHFYSGKQGHGGFLGGAAGSGRGAWAGRYECSRPASALRLSVAHDFSHRLVSDRLGSASCHVRFSPDCCRKSRPGRCAGWIRRSGRVRPFPGLAVRVVPALSAGR